uniref:Rhodopsin domain-containing protein n=1 Tax=Bionectria ochroleuca TaxID=29856 RepID=A0A8H7N6Z4_BIOOC
MSAYIDGVLVHMEAPDGYHVDFENPLRRRVPDIYYLSGVACLLSLLSMLQRFYTKAVLDKKIQADDYLLIFAYLSALATIGLTLLTFVETYAGVHAWEISEWNYCSLLIYTYISWAVYIICGSLAKLSLLAFYLRLSPQRWFYIATWTTIGFVIAYTIALLPTMLMGCKFVDGRLGGDDKITCPAVSMANAILNIVSDVILCSTGANGSQAAS